MCESCCALSGRSCVGIRTEEDGALADEWTSASDWEPMFAIYMHWLCVGKGGCYCGGIGSVCAQSCWRTVIGSGVCLQVRLTLSQ